MSAPITGDLIRSGPIKNKASSLSRRKFLTTAAGAGGAMLLDPAWLSAADGGIDPRVAQVMAATIAIDMHNHVYPAGTEPHPHFGREAGGPPRGPQGGPPPSGGGPQGGPPRTDEPQGPELFLSDELERSGLSVVCASYVLDFAANKNPGDARENFLQWLTAVDQQLDKGHIRRALTLTDLQSAHEHSKPTIVQTIEGAQFIEGKLDRVEEVSRRGLRHLQLLHMSDDMVKPLGDLNTDAPHLGGLTPFGADVVKECNRLGIVVDMAHASHETVLGALKASTQPLVI
jgi:membrane dipeptidase